jgi:hypothetical protein
VEVLATVAAMVDVTKRHPYLNRQPMYSERNTKTDSDTLDKVLTMYSESRGNFRIITLNMLASEVRHIVSGIKDLCLSASSHCLYRHLFKYGVVHHRVTHGAQHTRHDEGVDDGHVKFLNSGFKAGKYKASDTVKIDKTNIYVVLVSGSTLAGRGERTSWFATTVCSSRCTALLGSQ